MELSTYFRINAQETGQFERTLIVAEEGATSATSRAVPRRCATRTSSTRPSSSSSRSTTPRSSTRPCRTGTPATKGRGGIYNFVTKRGACRGRRSKISWTQVETGSAITWKYPSCILQGDDSVGEFYSVALTNNYQQADTGTKMIHIGKNTRSTIISKGNLGRSRQQQLPRGWSRSSPVPMGRETTLSATRFLLGDRCGAHTFPVSRSAQPLGAGRARGVDLEDRRGPALLLHAARPLARETPSTWIVNGFCKEVFRNLPMEFAVEAQKLLGVSLEGSVG
jgi:Fe-S cluster assembly protein SufB